MRHALRSALIASTLLSACAGGAEEPAPLSVVGSTPDASTATAPEAAVGPSDAAVYRPPTPTPPPANECTPGAYAGKFDCDVDGLPIWGGDLAFDLLQGSEGGGEFTSLVVRPGTKISGSDGYTGKFDGELAGEFDCTTGSFTGSLVRAVYLVPGAMYPVSMMGDIAGSYAPGSPPSLTGTMGPISSAEWGAIASAAQCTWQAERTGEASGGDAATLDAGAPVEPTTCPAPLSCTSGVLGESTCRDATNQAYPPCDSASPRCTIGDRSGLCRPGLSGGECTITCAP